MAKTMATAELLKNFIGGQVEIKHHGRHTTDQGELASVREVNNQVELEFSWMATRSGSRWIPDTKLFYYLQIELYSASGLRSSLMVLNSKKKQEMLVFLPPNADGLLDRKIIEGLGSIPSSSNPPLQREKPAL